MMRSSSCAFGMVPSGVDPGGSRRGVAIVESVGPSEAFIEGMGADAACPSLYHRVTIENGSTASLKLLSDHSLSHTLNPKPARVSTLRARDGSISKIDCGG
jgi:hypothetical protein